ncbi:MAG: biotin/lipoate A/B protein ligase family protein [Kiritimatiellales bacterium]
MVFQSDYRDVYRNLAMEEWLLDNAPELPVLVLYVNSPCVVIGKNQNPWRECRLSLMEQEGVPLARRVSGGGAVYHDEGNLNVGVIVSRTKYAEEKQYDLIFQTLEKFGIKGSRLGKNSLAVNDLKFSGQAFCYRRDRVLHHGTLLVNADLSRLGRYLGPEVDGIETKAVASVPAKVANLSSFAPELTVEKLSNALVATFQERYGSDGVTDWWSEVDVKKYAGTQFLPMIGKISSNDWKLGHTPRFTVVRNGQRLEVEKGQVVNLDGAPLFSEWVKG